MKNYRFEVKFIDLKSILVLSLSISISDKDYVTELVDDILDLTGFENKAKIVFVEANSLLEASKKINQNVYRIVSHLELK